MNQSDWENAKKAMLLYDGGASQIHLLSLPKSDIAHVFWVISKSIINPVVTLIANVPLETNIALSEFVCDKVKISQFEIGQSTITAKIFESADITFDLWSEKDSETFDLEIWFWADEFFPGDDTENQTRFYYLLSILKNIIKNGAIRCVLTPCEASDPLKDLEKGYGIEIELINA